MINRRQREKRQQLYKWLAIGILSFLIVLFAASLITSQSPWKVISGLWGNVSGYTDDPLKMNKKSLREYVLRQNVLIDSLSKELSDCNSTRVRKGLVNVDSPTLNMRTKPSLTSGVILRIPNGSEVLVNYYDTEKYFLDGIQGQWCNITYANQIGWVWGPYVKLIN
jgi:uncharacterized protein YgiM (DUF1202 family)